MSCSAALYTANTTAQTVAVGGTVALGSIVRRYGCGLALSGNVISITNPGYYDVDISVTAVPTAAGTVTVSLFQDGAAVPGATASETVAAAANSVSMSLSSLIRMLSSANVTNLSLLLTGAASSVTNVATVVEKI